MAALEIVQGQLAASAPALKKRQYLPGGTVGFCSVPGSACNEHHKRDVTESKRQYLPGGTIDFCSVPGSSCNEHHKRVEGKTGLRWFA